MTRPAVLDGYIFALLVLGVTGLVSCGPTGVGALPCGTLDTTDMGALETCASMSDCPGTDLCIGGYCTGSMCDAGLCQLSSHVILCVTAPGDSGKDSGGRLDAASDSLSNALSDATSRDARADATGRSDASKE